MDATLRQMRTAVSKWEARSSDLASDLQREMSHDQNCQCNELLRVHPILKSLKYRVGLEDVGEVSQALYRCLEGGVIGNTVVYYGALDERRILTVAEIEASSRVVIESGDDALIPYKNPNYKYLYVAFRKTEPAKNYWSDITTPLNNASIGGGDNLFSSQISVGDLNFYITNWQTIYFSEESEYGLLIQTK